MKTHNYIGRKAKVLERRVETPDSVTLRLKLAGKEKFAFNPGQFVLLSVVGFGEVPVGITTSPTEKEYIEVTVRRVGLVTEKISRLNTGDEVQINGPFGNGFPLGYLKGKNVVLVSGGIGLAPLRSLIHYQKDKKTLKSLTILNGAKSPENLFYQKEYADWEKFSEVLTTVDTCDKDWDGCVGMITKLFDQTDIQRGSVMIVCGPPIMFKSIIDRYAGKRVAEKDLFFLLERRMKCGIGKCQHCTCGKKYVCLDGPLFSYEQLKYNPEAFK